ncbi:glycosyltransferase family 2 protein [Pelosinus sp. sgz500959]|uniref:glycosyltransferase family 2 protein n=1 Tax=Pelosinus sp. sgz500959 TaxID=3242472 RepID=UPI003671BE91
MTGKQPVSFFIPAYNCEKNLEESVLSILKGNFCAGDEIVIVNDGSTDGTESIIDGLVADHPVIKKINHSVNKGGGAARNTAIENAQYDILFCLDSDNILICSTIQKLQEYMLQTSAHVASFGEICFFIGHRANITHKWIYKKETTLDDCLSTHMVPGASGNYLFTRESWQRAGGYPEFAGAMDTWGFGFRQLATGSKMVSMPDSYYLHRYGHESYWVRESKLGKISQINLEILRPYLDLIMDEDVDYIQSTEGRINWFDHLSMRPIRLKSGFTD